MDGTSVKEIEVIIREFLGGNELKTMIVADNYYEYRHDILKKVRKAIGKDGRLVTVYNLPNNKIMDNGYAEMVDQKAGYLLSKPLTLSTDKEEYLKELNTYFKTNLLKLIHKLGKDSYKYGKAYLYVYYNEQGKLSFKKFNAKEIIPVYKDADHEELEYVIRVYKTKDFTLGKYKEVTKVEVYTLAGIEYYIWDNGLIPANETKSYLTVNGEPYNWVNLPIIPFKCSNDEIPLITKVKSIQDAINELLSNFKDNMDEDNRSTILVIKNYGGEKGSLRTNLNTYGYIPVNSDGGVDTISIEVNAANYESILKILKKSLIENAKGFDAKADALRQGNPNEMNLKSMYSDIDLDATNLETEFKESLEKLIWFIQQDIITKNNKDYTNEALEIIFNKDMLMNESQVIADCASSIAILSKETVVSQHPWVKDSQKELEKVKKERSEIMDPIEKVYENDDHTHDVDE